MTIQLRKRLTFSEMSVFCHLSGRGLIECLKKKKKKKKKGDPDLFLLWWGGTMAVRVYNQSRSSTPAAISIPDGSLATKLKTSQQVSVICCESWVLWRKHLKRSAGDGCLLFLLKSISRLTLPLLPWWMRLCVCACNKATQTHTHAQTDGNTRCNRKKKKKKSVSHPCGACAHRAASVRGAGGCWGGGGWRMEEGGRGAWVALVDKCPPSYFQAPVSRWLINSEDFYEEQ